MSPRPLVGTGLRGYDLRIGGTRKRMRPTHLDTRVDQLSTDQLREPADSAAATPDTAEAPVLRPNWQRALFAPALALVRPHSAAACLATASRPAFITVLVLGLLILAGVLVGLLLWAATLESVWVPGPVAPATASSASGGTFMLPAGTWEVRSRRLSDVWQEWHSPDAGGWFGFAEIAATLVIVLAIGLFLFLGWLKLPFVHRSGSVWRSYRYAFRGTCVLLGPATVAMLLFGTAAILAKHGELQRGIYPRAAGGPPAAAFVVLVGAAVTLCGLALWSRLAAFAPRKPPRVSTQRCEGCGYDLTHVPDNGRCTECGACVRDSLDAELSRPGSPWSHRKTVGSWLSTCWAVLVRPSSFYRRLKLRTSTADDAGYAGLNYVLLTALALLWSCATARAQFSSVGPPRLRMELAPILTWAGAATLCGMVGVWAGHRTIAALVFSSWLVRSELPDFRWAAKVIQYESAFLWVFCAFWGLLASSFVFAQMWISHLIAPRERVWVVAGAATEFWVVVLGTLALAALWLWRYEIAYRAIRWGNH